VGLRVLSQCRSDAKALGVQDRQVERQLQHLEQHPTTQRDAYRVPWPSLLVVLTQRLSDVLLPIGLSHIATTPPSRSDLALRNRTPEVRQAGLQRAPVGYVCKTS